MSLAIWLAQVLLAAAFGMAGVMKTTLPIPELTANGVAWAADLPVALVRFIGACELAGAMGVMLPAVTRVRPGLTPLAAAGLATIMALAIVFHLFRGEAGALPFNLGLGALAVFVAWGRAVKAPIAPRRR